MNGQVRVTTYRRQLANRAYWAIVVAATLVSASCRTRPSAAPQGPTENGLPVTAYTGAPPAGYELAPPPPSGPPLPYQVHGEWSPPGLACPWPPEEYLCDGGDKGSPVAVSPNWELYGLGLEDTVAHYDALDGRTLVEPSNKVCIYAPRFGAVRVVTRIAANENIDQAGGVEVPQQLVRAAGVAIPASSLQRYQARGDVGTKIASAYRGRQGDGAVSSALFASGFQDTFMPFEDLSAIRNGILDQAEKARLSEGVQAAITWSEDVAVQAVLNGRIAIGVTQNERTEEVFTVKDLRHRAKLRVIKVASTQTAQPGEFVDFTLRFDNVGDQPLGNIVLADNLTTRLEYVPDSAQSSVKADFSVEPNEGDSLVLRWEIDQPLDPGEGGIVRFRCRVR
ncbi:MAG TPA: hypothetical protein VG826_02885 [Pirellulales bacterium]|nr:hypothetical protein [Pirellulales bacterium]